MEFPALKVTFTITRQPKNNVTPPSKMTKTRVTSLLLRGFEAFSPDYYLTIISGFTYDPPWLKRQ
mgnify:CR=1 FL=1